MSLSQYLTAMLVVGVIERLRAGGDTHAEAERPGHVFGALGAPLIACMGGGTCAVPGGGDSCAKAGATQRSVAAADAVRVRERRGDLIIFSFSF